MSGERAELAIVRRFYEAIWERGEEDVVAELIDPAFVFRGSLGEDTRGHAGFIDYLRAVRGALDEYRCEILDTVAEKDRVFARMRFSGVHRGPLLGHAATGRRVTWEGTALFHMANGRISELWVLGDVHGLHAQLAVPAGDHDA